MWATSGKSTDGSTWSNISGATANTYTAAEGDENGFLRVTASFTDDTAQTVTAASSATTKVTDVTPGLTVSLSGVPQDGVALTAIPAVIKDGDSSAADVTYQWQWSADDATWNNIGGATGGSYTPTTADVGHFVRTEALSSDDTGQSALNNSPGMKINPRETVPINFQVFDQTTGKTTMESGEPYPDPSTGLKWQFIKITTDNLNIAAVTPNTLAMEMMGSTSVRSAGITYWTERAAPTSWSAGRGTIRFMSMISMRPFLAGQRYWDSILATRPRSGASPQMISS
jgi:hypothetical protein